MKTLYLAAERVHSDALSAARRAIRAGDLVQAERWMKLCERHWRCAEYARLQQERERTERFDRFRARAIARAKAKA